MHQYSIRGSAVWLCSIILRIPPSPLTRVRDFNLTSEVQHGQISKPQYANTTVAQDYQDMKLPMPYAIPTDALTTARPTCQNGAR